MQSVRSRSDTNASEQMNAVDLEAFLLGRRRPQKTVKSRLAGYACDTCVHYSDRRIPVNSLDQKIIIGAPQQIARREVRQRRRPPAVTRLSAPLKPCGDVG